MTAKRFKASEYYEVWDNDKFLLSFDQTVDLLNELNDENEQLKQLLDYADDLIQSYMSVHNRDEWENVKKNIIGNVE